MNEGNSGAPGGVLPGRVPADGRSFGKLALCTQRAARVARDIDAAGSCTLLHSRVAGGALVKDRGRLGSAVNGIPARHSGKLQAAVILECA